MANIRIAVCNSEGDWVPEGEAFVPVLIGAATGTEVPEGWERDDAPVPDDAPVSPVACPSERAYAWGELCGLWWAWQHLRSDYVGLAANGTFLASSYGFDKRRCVADEGYLSHRLATRAIVVPNEANWIFETAHKHFLRRHRAIGLEVLRDALAEVAPKYLPKFDSRQRQTHGHDANVFLMRRDRLGDFCPLVFEVISNVEKSLLMLGANKMERNELADLAAQLVDPWLETNRLTPVEITVSKANGRGHVPANVSYLEQEYRAKYAPTAFR